MAPSSRSELTAWERIELARHLKRPQMLFYVSHLFDDFIELHGDRFSGDDPAMVCGIARFEGETVFVVGQQKGVSTDDKVRHNFGMAHPEGYRKALRIFRMAARLGYPVISFVDTPAAYPGIEAEARGQGMAIANNLLELASLDIPIFAVILGEGGSGGALGIAVADYVAMFEYAVYMICPPERCAEILWRDMEEKKKAAEALRITASDLLALGIIDKVLPEPEGGAHEAPEAAVKPLEKEIREFLAQSKKGVWSLERRRARIRNTGQWHDRK
ncbi:MAG: acetyl-CoA carboxylase carboxyltransferase subunit alpha [Candidatus Hydrogenedentes bacterium]|nr:acetyl-CoA carboxylase carboxyltransferase subunit alpha [Candidatus Hydrogenedentota bacterium]